MEKSKKNPSHHEVENISRLKATEYQSIDKKMAKKK